MDETPRDALQRIWDKLDEKERQMLLSKIKAPVTIEATIVEEKLCKLTNARFSWILDVDGQTISFQGAINADYFAVHYESLGYKVEWEKEE